MNKQIIDNIYCRHIGSGKFYKWSYCNNLIYTEGIMDFQLKLQAFWLIDNIISHLSKIIQNYKLTEDGFFIVKINVKADKSAILKIVQEDIYQEYITILRQYIPFVDLIEYDYKFYLILSCLKPITFTLLLPNEY